MDMKGKSGVKSARGKKNHLLPKSIIKLQDSLHWSRSLMRIRNWGKLETRIRKQLGPAYYPPFLQ